MPEIEVILEEMEDGAKRLTLLLHQASIVEHDGELTPGCTLDAQQSRSLAAVLEQRAGQLES